MIKEEHVIQWFTSVDFNKKAFQIIWSGDIVSLIHLHLFDFLKPYMAFDKSVINYQT